MDESRINRLRKKAKSLLNISIQQNNLETYKDDFEKLIEEFSTYQVELELQNEELLNYQTALENEKRKFTDLYINAPSGYIQFSAEGKILSINKKMLEILGLPEPLIVGKEFTSFLDSDNMSIFKNHLKSVFNSTDHYEKTAQIALKDSKKDVKHLKLVSNIMVDTLENYRYCRTIVEEETELINLTKNLKKLNDRLEASLRAGNLAWWEVHLPSGEVFFNENKAIMIGRDANDFTHYTHFTDLLHPDDYEHTMQAFRDHLEGKAKNYECEYRIKHKEGHYKWFYDIGRVSSVTDNEAILTGIVYDITDRKEAEIEKEISENNFKNVLDIFIDPIHITDLDKRIIYMNNSMKKMIGKDKTGQKCFEAIFNRESRCPWCKCDQILLEKEKVATYEMELEQFKKTILVRKQLLDNKTIITVYDDITGRKNAEKKIFKQYEKLNEIQKISKIGYWELDIAKNKLTWSDEIFKMFDLDSKTFTPNYEEFLANIHPDDREYVNQEYQESLKSKNPYDIVHRLKLRSGELKYVREKCSTIFDKHGKPLISKGIVQDVYILQFGL